MKILTNFGKVSGEADRLESLEISRQGPEKAESAELRDEEGPEPVEDRMGGAIGVLSKDQSNCCHQFQDHRPMQRVETYQHQVKDCSVPLRERDVVLCGSGTAEPSCQQARHSSDLLEDRSRLHCGLFA